MIGVIDTEGDCAEWTFPAEPGSVRSARHAVRDALDCWGLPPAVGDTTVLLVSELVTNSLQYASGPIGVRLERLRPSAESNGSGELTGDFTTDLRLAAARPPVAPGLLVEVSDPLPDPPTERSAGPDDEGGRGLQLVACSARRWGTRRGKSGKTVWFELALPG
ncbi:ATP-binding protein [Streptomyces bacillaris]|uniref:ATP-binding protein n=1 Tax=unclassified Streptomyces TaxID=2593676 RepID=UPI00035E7F4E|nr:ATP-binding protein [Streptomyces sp. CcalMP-8W]MYT35915.1 ATP-binding protein [Streptomyces sp. SID8356]